MNILIDTHIFLWAVNGDKRLKQKHIELLESAQHTFYLSTISVAEVMIKVNIGKLKFDGNIQSVSQQMGLEFLTLEAADVLSLKTMPRHHNDPFDRMLISQSVNRNFPILTDDKKFSLYDCTLI